MRRRALALFGFATGLGAATALYRRSATRRRDSVDLYFADGSMVSLGDDAPAAARLLPIARRIVETARNGGA
jgi:hypothetical protein